MSTEYNGWRNVETWRTQLHLANDEGEAGHMLNMARWHVGSPLYDNFEGVSEEVAELQGDLMRPTTPNDNLADYVRKYVTLSALAQLTNRGPETWYVFANDTVDAALERVDWERIAEHWLDAARHELKPKGATT